MTPSSDDQKRFEKARLSRDPRFDGKFFIGVKTTGIYCRPVCKVKLPKAGNCTFFLSAAGAAEAGFRPCLRCRPEASPGTPAWLGTSTTVNRALRLIAEGALDSASIEALSDRLGVTPRHLSRLFAEHIGASPKSVAQTRRLHFAKKLINETRLSMTEIGLASGYKSVRRFNDHVKQVYKRTPTELRRDKQENEGFKGFVLQLGYRQPFDFESILSFLKVRAIPGVETVESGRYERTIKVKGYVSKLVVTQHETKPVLELIVESQNANQLLEITNKVRRLFDLDADPFEVTKVLHRDTELRSILSGHDGQRLPGCWSAFEIAVRAIVGQQISVKGATTVMGRIADLYGDVSEYGLCFPEPAQLRKLDTKTLSMPSKRAQAIKDLASAVDEGEIHFGADVSPNELVQQLMSIKGIGPWTAQYVAMRAINDPDAFLIGDLVLEKVAAKVFGIQRRQDLLEHAEKWRPWRAYAGMHMWRVAADID